MRNLLNFIFKFEFRKELINAAEIKLNVGAGGTSYAGWISAEKNQLDITKSETFKDAFKFNSISAVLAEHVIEHITKKDFIEFLYGIKPYLKQNSTIRIAVPDAFHPSEYVRNLTMPGGYEPGADDHKEFYSIDHMLNIAQLTGYKVVPIEYFDHSGIFVFQNDDWSNGFINRSFKHYKGRFTNNPKEFKKMIESTPLVLREQFYNLKMSYTSLIVDFINS